MSLYDSFETDPTLEKEGRWFVFGSTTRIKIRPISKNNVQYKALMERLTKPHRSALRNESLAEEVALDLALHGAAKALIVGWETLVDEKWVSGIEQKGSAELLPFAEDNVKKTLKALPILFEKIQQEAVNFANFLQGSREEDAKN